MSECCSCSAPKDADIIIDITEEETLFLQRLIFEKDGLKLLVTQFTSESPYKPDEETYDKVLKQYIESFVKYNIGFQAVVETYIDQIRDKIKGKSYQTVINFATKELLITIQ